MTFIETCLRRYNQTIMRGSGVPKGSGTSDPHNAPSSHKDKVRPMELNKTDPYPPQDTSGLLLRTSDHKRPDTKLTCSSSEAFDHLKKSNTLIACRARSNPRMFQYAP